MTTKWGIFQLMKHDIPVGKDIRITTNPLSFLLEAGMFKKEEEAVEWLARSNLTGNDYIITKIYRK